jgi:hypothetical protein
MNAQLASLAAAKDAVATLESIVTIGAVLLGGAWAYFKFINGRVFTTRLEPDIDGRIVRQAGSQLAVIKVRIKNVGLTRARIDNQHSTVEVLAYPASNYFPQFHNAIFDTLGPLRAVTLHGWIEPGEQIEEEHLIALPITPFLALRLQLRLLQHPARLWSRGVEWNAVAVVTPNDPAKGADATEEDAGDG